MTRTTRDRKHSNAMDGEIWRDCGDKKCVICMENRQNVKLKVQQTMRDLEGNGRTL